MPKVHPQSRAIVVSVNTQARTDTLLAQYEHRGRTVLRQPGQHADAPRSGDVFVGWGAEPYFSEFSSSGQLLYDAHLHGSYQSYRAYRFPWTGTPAAPPAIAASTPERQAGPLTVYASWNGDTRHRELARARGTLAAAQLTPVAGAPRSGFETTIATPGPEPYVAVQALDACRDGAGNLIDNRRVDPPTEGLLL